MGRLKRVVLILFVVLVLCLFSASMAGGLQTQAEAASFVPVVTFYGEKPFAVTIVYYEASPMPVPTSTPVPTATSLPTATAVPSPTPLPTATPTAEVVPTQVVVKVAVQKVAQTQVQVAAAPKQIDVAEPTAEAVWVSVGEMRISGHMQTWNSTCESSAAGDVLSTLTGVPAVEWETRIVLDIPLTDSPSTGFWGDPNGEPMITDIRKGSMQPPVLPIEAYTGPGYGVYPQPLADSLNRLAAGYMSANATNLSFANLATNIGLGHPVMVWVINSPVKETRVLADGTRVWQYEHSVLAVGAGYWLYPNGNRFYFIKVVDPHTGSAKWRAQDDFYRGTWQNQFAGASVVITPKSGHEIPVIHELSQPQ